MTVPEGTVEVLKSTGIELTEDPVTLFRHSNQTIEPIPRLRSSKLVYMDFKYGERSSKNKKDEQK